MSREVIGRWETFLSKIRAQFDQLMQEAEQGCLALLDLSLLDPTPMSNAWMGIRAEILALGKRIWTVWEEKVEPAFREAGLADEEIDRQQERGRRLEAQLDLEGELRQIEIFAAAGARILEAARLAAARSFSCTQCGGQLAIPPQVFRSINVTCDFCGSVNTHEPGTRVRQVEHFCAHHLSQKAAVKEWRTIQDLERQRHDSPGDRIEILRALEQAWRRYWETYFGARAELVPDFAPDLARDIESRMRAFHDDMGRSSTWLAHNR